MPRPTKGELVVDDYGKITDTGYSTPAIKRVTDQHRRVGRLKVKGLTHKEIKEKTGFSFTHISRIIANATVKNEMEKYRTSLAERGINKLIAAVPDAADVLIDDLAITGNDPRLRKLRQTAAVEVFEKGTGIKKDTGDTFNTQVNIVALSDQELMRKVLEIGE